MIKHLSLDFWNTLAIANPKYAERRTAILQEYSGLGKDVLQYRYNKVKRELDDQAIQGKGQDSSEAFQFLVEAINPEGWTFENKRELMVNLNHEFYLNPPTVPTDIAFELIRLNDDGITLSISSNTNFIPGSILKQVVLDHLGAEFKFMIFSDELGVTKPHKHFFTEVLYHSQRLAREVLHVGDSIAYDVGAIDAGMQFALIGGPEDLTPILQRF